VQFGANAPLEFARAASLVAPYTSGVDLNCGCPQSWACAETLGAALMDRRDLVRDMVLAARARLRANGFAVALDADRDDPRGRSVSVKSMPLSGGCFFPNHSLFRRRDGP